MTMTAAARGRTHAVLRALIYALGAYLLLLGGTFTGMVAVPVRWTTLGLLGALLTVWMAARVAGRWPLHRVRLGWALAAWGVAVGLSAALNAVVWWRVGIGVWYAGAFALGWLVVLDLYANRALFRRDLLALLVGAAAFHALLALWQLRPVLNGAELMRPGGLLGNPNALGSLVAIALPTALSAFAAARRPWARLAATLLTVLLAGVLLLSRSRGALLGAGAGVFVWAALTVGPRRAGAWWRVWPRALRAAALAGVVVAVLGGAVWLVGTLNDPMRGVGLRTYLYETAGTLVAQRPLAGHGPFTFGGASLRLVTAPPLTAHTHAHNLALHVAAELGLLGAAALALTIVLSVRAVQQVWQAAPAARPSVAAGVAGLAAYGVHGLFDVPGMMAAIALVAGLLLAAAVAPPAPARVGRAGAVAWWAGVLALIVGLGTSAVWDTSRSAALDVALRQPDPFVAAQLLADGAAREPGHPLWHYQRGLLLAEAAFLRDDVAALRAAEQAFAAFVALEPDFWPGRYNLLALRIALGEATTNDPATALPHGVTSPGNVTAPERAALEALQAERYADALTLGDTLGGPLSGAAVGVVAAHAMGDEAGVTVRWASIRAQADRAANGGPPWPDDEAVLCITAAIIGAPPPPDPYNCPRVLAAAHTTTPLQTDVYTGGNYATIHSYRAGWPRLFVPQARYPVGDTLRALQGMLGATTP